MITDYEYIDFMEVGHKPRTKVWAVIAKESGACLGQVKWFSAWRKYTFSPEPCTVFCNTCLYDIGTFLTQAMEEHRLMKKEQK